MISSMINMMSLQLKTKILKRARRQIKISLSMLKLSLVIKKLAQ